MAGSGVDARALDALIRRIRSASHGGSNVYERTKRALAAEALTRVAAGFRGSRDPEGNAWPPLALREGKPLLDTGRLRNWFNTEILPEGFRIGTNWRWVKTHQYGATIVPKIAKALRFAVGRGKGRRWFVRKKVTIPARPMLPTRGKLPEPWARAFRRIAERLAARALGPST